MIVETVHEKGIMMNLEKKKNKKENRNDIKIHSKSLHQHLWA